MDLGTTSTSPRDASPPAAAHEPRPLPGFYTSGSSIFYVAPGASVFLLRTADEAVCLHVCRHLPDGADVATAPRMGPMLELLARTADQLSRPTGPLGSVQVEVRRDRIIGIGAALQATLESVAAELGTLLMDEYSPDPEGFHERLTERLQAIQQQCRNLNNQRINRRGGRACTPAPPHVPLAAAAFVHRGEYVGRYSDMAAAGTVIHGRTSNAAGSLRDAHLRGELWTVSRDGMVYVFRCPPEPA